MGYALRKGLSFCFATDQLIFLDLLRNRYFSLSADCDRAFRTFLSGQGANENLAPDPRLVALGILSAKPANMRIAPCDTAVPARAALSINLDHRLPWLLSSGYHLTRAAWSLKHRSFCRAACGSTIARTKASSEHQLISIAKAFARWGAITGTHDQCLVRAIALRNLLAGRGIDVTVTFGVKMGQFGAHCWVHKNDLLLSDDLEAVLPFTPIASL